MNQNWHGFQRGYDNLLLPKTTGSLRPNVEDNLNAPTTSQEGSLQITAFTPSPLLWSCLHNSPLLCNCFHKLLQYITTGMLFLRYYVFKCFPESLCLELASMFLAELHDLWSYCAEVVTWHGWK